MQQIYRQSDQQIEVFTTVFSPQGGHASVHMHTRAHNFDTVSVISEVEVEPLCSHVCLCVLTVCRSRSRRRHVETEKVTFNPKHTNI